MQIMPRVGWVIPILVACSSLGTALVAVSHKALYVLKFDQDFILNIIICALGDDVIASPICCSTSKSIPTIFVNDSCFVPDASSSCYSKWNRCNFGSYAKQLESVD